ncbi:MAG: S9 family peptidase [Planctomycetes bacterium]|nr:S9 family peptidase [Planctomycetota bacterium]
MATRRPRKTARVTRAATPARRSARSPRGTRRTSASAPVRRLVTADDVLRLRTVGDPRVSPDGAHVVFVVKHVGDRFDYRTNLWMADADGGEPRQLTSGDSDRAPRWSPDGRTLAFLRTKDKGRPQVWLLPVDGGEATKLTDFPEGTIAGLRWSPDGSRLGVVFRPQADEWTLDAAKEREKQGRSDPPRVIDDPWYRFDGDGYFGAQRFALYVADATSGAHRLVYDGDRLGQFHWDWAPDGKRIALATNRDAYAFAKEWTAELLVLDVDRGTLKRLPGLPKGPKAGVAWSPDGRSIAWAGILDDDGTRQSDNVQLFVSDPVKGGARNLLAKTDWCLVAPVLSDASEVEFAARFCWTPDSKRLWMQIGWHGETQLATVPARGGEVVFHTSGKRQHQLGNLSSDGSRLALVVDAPDRPVDVYVAEVPPAAELQRGGRLALRQVSHVNRELLAELDLADVTDRWVTSADGTAVQMWIMLPPGADARKKRPTILEVHGGPQAQYGWNFFHEFQLLAAQGYAVVFSNPRGSKGYGQEFTRGIHWSWGKRDWEDVQAVLAEVEAQPFCDRKRLGIMGGSYGGFMTLWAIGHDTRFRAAISDRCVSNMIAMWGSSDVYMWPNSYFPGNAWDDVEASWEMSPLKHIGNVVTPTLLIHSEGDLRCNVAESEQVHSALALRGVPVRFVRYPKNTSHGMSRGGPPDMRIHRLGQIVAWWKQWMGR